MSKHKVIIVDDHTLFRNGLKLLLNQSGIVDVIEEASNGQEFLDMIERFPESIVFMDIEMPVLNGIEATKLAVEKYPDLKIIALTMFSDKAYYYKMIEAGVKGFLLKDSGIEEVINSIEKVAKGENCFSNELLLSIVKDIQQIQNVNNNIENLSDREQEILRLICSGLSNQEIGDQLFISKRTVDKHRSNIMDKTDCKNTAGLVMYAIKNSIIQI